MLKRLVRAIQNGSAYRYDFVRDFVRESGIDHRADSEVLKRKLTPYGERLQRPVIAFLRKKVFFLPRCGAQGIQTAHRPAMADLEASKLLDCVRIQSRPSLTGGNSPTAPTWRTAVTRPP
jgi:hypothetical protein